MTIPNRSISSPSRIPYLRIRLSQAPRSRLSSIPVKSSLEKRHTQALKYLLDYGYTPNLPSQSRFERLNMPTTSSLTTNGLVKNTLADRLRKEIMDGSLQPGMRIVEAKWASEFGVAQGSIREAINILAHAGFVTKASGRSARVVHFSEGDVAHIYQLRGAIEGLAARLAVATQPNLNVLQATVDVMREAASEGNCDGLLDCDSLYHLELCELSRNPYVIEHARRILLPFFAFVRMRVAASGQAASAWDKDLEAHQRIIDLLRDGEGEVAEQYVKKAMERFAKTAYDNWEKRIADAG
jgi:DNA-binding GntR family transcriptional regulator